MQQSEPPEKRVRSPLTDEASLSSRQSDFPSWTSLVERGMDGERVSQAVTAPS
jgi:hypothetical protein